MKYKIDNNKVLIIYSEFFIIKFHKLILHIDRRSLYDIKIRYHYRISILQKLNNKKYRKARDIRFKNRNAKIKLRPKMRLLAIERWQTTNRSRKNSINISTKSYIRIDICPPGVLTTKPRAWD